MGGGTEPVAPRSTASQMQRGSGELQSTPTGFWKLQSDPAGAGHGSIAAGIGAWSLLRSASLTAHMGRSRTLYTGSWTMSRRRNTEDTIKQREDGWFLVELSNPSLGSSHPRVQTSRLLAPVHRRHRRAFRKFNPTSSTSQPVSPELRESALQDSRTHSNTLRGVQSRESRRQQMEECVWRRDQR